MLVEKTNILQLRDLRVDLDLHGGTVHAVRGLSIGIAAGEIHGLVGESGSGKSMTALAIAGLSPPAARVQFGELQLSGRNMKGASPGQWRMARRDDIGFIFQNPMRSLNPRLTVGSQLREALTIQGPRSATEIYRRSLELLAAVELGSFTGLLRQYPHELSGGMAQRVMIALALSRNPRLLIADEPTTALDVSVQAQILDLIDRLRAQYGLAVLLVSHDLDVIRDRADTVSVMYRGEVVEHGSAQTVTLRPQHAYTQRLLSAAPANLPDPARAGKTDWTDPEPVLEARAVSRSFRVAGFLPFLKNDRYKPAVSDVSLQLRRGDSLGIVGETGSGKTTLARMLVGLETPDRGEIFLRGRPTAGFEPQDRRKWHEEVQFVFQDNSSALNPRMTVGDSITEPLRARGVPEDEWKGRLRQVLVETGLEPDFALRKPHQLSGGQRQRIGIARALISDPKVIVADEPVSALDVSVQAGILKLLNELRRSRGISYVVISHDIGVIRYICTRIAVIYRGQCVESGDVGTVLDNPQHPYTRALLAAVPGQKADRHLPDVMKKEL